MNQWEHSSLTYISVTGPECVNDKLSRVFVDNLGPVSMSRSVSEYSISIIMIRRSCDRLIFIMGIPTQVRSRLHIETAPWCRTSPDILDITFRTHPFEINLNKSHFHLHGFIKIFCVQRMDHNVLMRYTMVNQSSLAIYTKRTFSKYRINEESYVQDHLLRESAGTHLTLSIWYRINIDINTTAFASVVLSK